MKRTFLSSLFRIPVLSGAVLATARAQPMPLADAINQLGLDLYRQQANAPEPRRANLLLSPYSIQSALAMVYAGADGATRDEMRRVLHFSAEDVVPAQFEKLRTDLAAAAAKNDVQLATANRLFARRGYAFRTDFLALLKERYAAPLQEMNFAQSADSAAAINRWVEQQTKEKIRDLISADAFSADTRLVLVNALYFRARWDSPFQSYATKPAPFHVSRSLSAEVPTMRGLRYCGYAKKSGFSVVTLPYDDGHFQFVVVLPASGASTEKIMPQITPVLLAECTKLSAQSIFLSLPKFKVGGPSINLRDALTALGMKTAFDEPVGSANFDRMAPRKPDDYLTISQVVHKTWMDLNEDGTEAAAATAVMMAAGSAAPREKPPEVRVDRPFLFAIQHVASGTCLFLGRVTDPRVE